MKEDWDASSDPSLVGVKAHANDVANHHHAKVQRSKDQETSAQRPARGDEKTAFAKEIKADLSVDGDDENLSGEQLGVRHKPRHPLLHRRQKRDVKECNQNLTENAKAEKKQKRYERPEVATLQDFRNLRSVRQRWCGHTASPNMAW